MRPLIKVMLILGAIFATTFVAGRLLGILTVENVRLWLEAINNTHPGWVAALVVILLFADLLIAVPTLSITILAGYFLGFPAGFAAAVTGMSLAAFAGYAISRVWGDIGVNFLIRDDADRQDLRRAFHRSGPAMITLSRAAPMVPEVTACMAGVSRMPFARYILFFALSTLPYAAIAAYAGSVSTLDDPRPAIFAIIFLYGTLWTGWFLFRRRRTSADRTDRRR